MGISSLKKSHVTLTNNNTSNNNNNTSNNNTRKRGGNNKRNISLGEVKKHNKKNDAWTIIENKVYNITSWIPKHPGGEIIMQALGKDATQLFIDNNHPSYVKKTILPKYYIGTLK